MAHFAIRNLSVLCYANGFTLWQYAASHPDDVGPHFFADAQDMLAAGDVVIVTSKLGARLFVMVDAPPALHAVPLS